MDEQDVMKMQQRKDFLVKFCYWAVIAVCIYAVSKYLLPVLFPFLLAFIKKLNDKGMIHLLH